jgi:hypothetical protein
MAVAVLTRYPDAGTENRSRLREGLTVDERCAVADRGVSQLKQHGDPRELSEQARPGPDDIAPPTVPPY